MFFSKFPVLRSTAPKLNSFLRNVTYCETPEPRPTVVTIIGGHTGEGQLTALLLKQSKIIDEIRLYSGIIDVCGIALDLSHIDTNPVIKGYTGQHLLKDAISDAQVVLVCGGQSKRPCKKQCALFEENADYVRNIGIFMAEFNPHGILCISTPPVCSLVPMVSEEMMKETSYDPRKVIGIMTLGVIRSNSIVAKYINKSPTDVSVPVIGGMCRDTIVPVYSQLKPKVPVDKCLAQLFQDKIIAAEDEALDLKYIENTGSCFASGAYACARFVTSVLKGLRGDKGIVECGFVRQMGRIENFLPYMGSVITLGCEGIEKTHMPKINDFECQNLLRAYHHLKTHITMGRAYIIGDPQKECTLDMLSGYCKLVEKEAITTIGDFKIDFDIFNRKNEEKCVEIIT